MYLGICNYQEMEQIVAESEELVQLPDAELYISCEDIYSSYGDQSFYFVFDKVQTEEAATGDFEDYFPY
jgi:hypothetical protein